MRLFLITKLIVLFYENVLIPLDVSIEAPPPLNKALKYCDITGY